MIRKFDHDAIQKRFDEEGWEEVNASLFDLKAGDEWWLRVPSDVPEEKWFGSPFEFRGMPCNMIPMVVDEIVEKNGRKIMMLLAGIPDEKLNNYEFNVDIELHAGQYRTSKGMLVAIESGVYYGAWVQYEEELRKMSQT